MDTNTPAGTGDQEPLTLSEAARSYASIEADDSEQEHPEAHEEGEEHEPAASENDDLDGGEEGDQQDEEHAPEESDPGYVSGDNVKVKLEDGTETTVGELKRGTLRQADYTRKQQELSQQRQHAEQTFAQYQQQAEQLAQTREYTLSVLNAMMPEPPSDDLLNIDPVGYMRANKAYNDQLGHLQNLQAQHQQAESERNFVRQQKHAEHIARNMQQFFEKNPTLKDPQKLEAFKADAYKYAGEYGITPAEVHMIEDHRVMAVMQDAIAYRKLKAQKAVQPKPGEARPPVQRGGQRVGASAQKARETRSAMDRLKSSGSIRDGVAALLAIEKER